MNTATVPTPAAPAKPNDAQSFIQRLREHAAAVSCARGRLVQLSEAVFGPTPKEAEGVGDEPQIVGVFPQAESALRDCERDMAVVHNLIDDLIARLTP